MPYNKKASTPEENLEKDKMEMGRSTLLRLVNTLDAESQLSERLTKKFGEQFDFSALKNNCKLYLIYSFLFKKVPINGATEIPKFQVPFTCDQYHFLICDSCPKARIFMKNQRIIVTDLLLCLSTLLKVAYLKGFLAVHIKKAHYDLLNRRFFNLFLVK